METVKGFYASAVEIMDEGSNLMTITGKHHADCIEKIKEKGFMHYYNSWHEDGFMVLVEGCSVFLGRDEATELAKALGVELSGTMLTSEDLWGEKCEQK